MRVRGVTAGVKDLSPDDPIYTLQYSIAKPARPRLRGLSNGLRLLWIHSPTDLAVHGYLTSRAIHAPVDVALGSMGFYVLAPVMGFLALAAPGGLGVREAVVSIALSAATSPAAALYAALLSRGTSVIVDFGVWMIFRPFRDRGARPRS